MSTNTSMMQLGVDPVVLQTLRARALTFITITLWLLTLATAAVGIEKSRWALGNAYIIGVLVCLGGSSLLNSVWLWRKCMTAPVFSNYTRFVFAALLFWCVVTILRIDWFNWRGEVRLAWSGQFYAWAWVVPVSMVLGSDIGMWKRALRVVAWTSAIGCIILVAGWTLISLHGDFGFTQACPIALLFLHYLPKRIKKIVLLGSLTTVFLSILAATRNEVFSKGLLILFASYIQFFRRHFRRLRTRVYIIVAFSIVFLIINYAASVDHIPLVGETINRGIVRFNEKLGMNSRVTVSGDSIYAVFLRDIRGLDLAIGRGCMGAYEMIYGTHDSRIQQVGRRYIECGYLQVILHGGVFMLILILALAIPAIYLGMFRSRNWFTRGCAFLVLGRLLEMVPFGLPIMDVKYMLFWMAIGACLTWKIRAMSDADIVGIFASEYALGVEEER